MDKLSGKRVVITRPKTHCQQFANLFQIEGAIPICIPVIEISALEDTQTFDQALGKLTDYDWLVLTSANGVKAVFTRLKVLRIHAFPETLKIACIGPKTASTLEAQGIQADFVPDEYIAEAILPGLGNLDGLKVLLARADIARPDLPDAIRAGGGTADDICAYQTLPAKPDKDGLVELTKGVDVLTFTSPSAVENFFQVMIEEGLDPLNLPGAPITACIGPITAKAAQNKGYQVRVIPDEYTIEGLLDAIKDYFRENVYEQY